MEKKFLLGASTAAHQVEGNNKYSDYWALEQMENSGFKEPSLDAADHYNRYEEDIRFMAEAGLNAYRFSVEWARIEPEQGKYDDNAIEHYRKVLECCKANGMIPVVTMHHFSSPKWLISQGGWEDERTVNAFAAYCKYVVSKLGDLLEYVCTINEANMGLQIAAVARDMMRQMGIAPQVGVRFEMPKEFLAKQEAEAAVFGLEPGQSVNTFLSLRSENGDLLIMRAHEAARKSMKEVCPHLKVGLTLSLFDLQAQPDGMKAAEKFWEDDFAHYLPYVKNDDFIGVQNYTRKLVGADGALPAPEGAEVTEMGYEFYPEGIGHVIRHVAESLSIPILVTENGIATNDDSRRMEYIKRALAGVKECLDDGIPVIGYLHWSLLDNFEWQEGFAKKFGLIAVDRTTQQRNPKPSLKYLGTFREIFDTDCPGRKIEPQTERDSF